MIKWIGQATGWAEARTRGMVGFGAYAAVVIIGMAALGMAWIREYGIQNLQTACVAAGKAHSEGMSVLEKFLHGKELCKGGESSSRTKPYQMKEMGGQKDHDVLVMGKSDLAKDLQQQLLSIPSSAITTPTQLTPYSAQRDTV